MPDAEPGTIAPESGWPGRWVTIDRAYYHDLVKAAGGRDALIVYSSRTQPDPEDYYVLTSLGREDGSCPLVQVVLEGCDNSLPPADHAKCPGTHTFSRFAYDPELEED